MKCLSQGKEKLISSYLTLRAPESSRLPVKSVFWKIFIDIYIYSPRGYLKYY